MPRLAVSNTSPLQYLYQLSQIHLLSRFYTEVAIPPTVDRELAVGRSLGVNLPDLETLPWIHIRVPAHTQPFISATTLGGGEREVLALALEIPDSLLIIDDGHARRLGRLLGLSMAGTIGILARAKREGLIPQLAPSLNQLDALGFRLSTEARAVALELAGEGC